MDAATAARTRAGAPPADRRGDEEDRGAVDVKVARAQRPGA